MKFLELLITTFLCQCRKSNKFLFEYADIFFMKEERCSLMFNKIDLTKGVKDGL